MGELWSPFYFHAEISLEQDVTFIASTEEWNTIFALDPGPARGSECVRRETLISTAEPTARRGLAEELVLAADQFLITPSSRLESPRGRSADPSLGG